MSSGGTNQVDSVDTITARHIRTRLVPDDANVILAALTRGRGVRDTRGLAKGAAYVTEVLAQHAQGGRYAELYPLPSLVGKPVRVAQTMLCDVWQFTYPDGAVHGHVMLHSGNTTEAYVCATPFCMSEYGLMGTTSRRPAQEPTKARSDHAAFESYLFDRADDVACGWVLSSPSDITVVAEVDSAHDIRKLCVRVPAPGEDLHFDAGAGYLEADYVLHRKLLP